MTESELIKQFFSIAQSDLTVAKRLFEDFYPKELHISCFHSQQCAEKALKGYLQHCHITPPKTHDLSQLCRMCIDQDTAFSSILEICAKLSVYGVILRYPNENIIDDIITKTNIDRAGQIYDFCAARTPEIVM